MALTCWKWHDMSVANTISTTRALSSLERQSDTRRDKRPRAAEKVPHLHAYTTCQSHRPPVVFGEVVEDVHFIVVLQEAVRSADVVAFQHCTVVVQDGRVRSARDDKQ